MMKKPSQAICSLIEKVKTVDPLNATIITGYLLLQKLSDDQLIYIAFTPVDVHFTRLVSIAKTNLLNSHFGSLIDVGHNGHRRSYPANAVCMYYARGFCRSGSNCRFLHDHAFVQHQQGQNQKVVGSSRYYQYEQIQQSDAQSSRAALTIGEENPRSRQSNEFLSLGSNSSARQIYLTFPPESTFSDEDVSKHFSKYGHVLDVRIPHLPKRMFGFVTFLYPKTVKEILNKGNPHFICGCRVLVKRYQENKKIQEKHHHHQPGNGKSPACSSPKSIRTPKYYELQSGPDNFNSTHELMQRRNQEELADLDRTIENQEMKLMNLQLQCMENNPSYRPQQSMPLGCPISSSISIENSSVGSFDANQIITKDYFNGSPANCYSTAIADAPEQEQVQQKVDGNESMQEGFTLDMFDPEADTEDFSLPENLFGSYKKSAGSRLSVFADLVQTEKSSDHSDGSHSENALEPNAHSANLASQ